MPSCLAMINIHRHNPILRERLSFFIKTRNASGMGQMLEQLPHSAFRTAGYILAEDLLPALRDGSAFMDFFLRLVPQSPKAYLGTFLRAAVRLHAGGVLSLSDSRWADFATKASSIDSRKLLDTFLPLAETVQEIVFLLKTFCAPTLEAQGPFLLKAGTAVSYCHLFHLLRLAEGDDSTLKHYYVLLLRKGDQRSYNMASIIRVYFGLSNLPGNFSLQLKPYQLGRIEDSPQQLIDLIES